MEVVLLVIHLMLALALVGVVLLQRSEGGGLGIGGGTGGLMSVRGTANLLTRTTAVLAACFMVTSLTLAIMAGNRGETRSILDQPGVAPIEQPQPQPEPVEPRVPLSQ